MSVILYNWYKSQFNLKLKRSLFYNKMLSFFISLLKFLVPSIIVTVMSQFFIPLTLDSVIIIAFTRMVYLFILQNYNFFMQNQLKLITLAFQHCLCTTVNVCWIDAGMLF